MTLKEWSEKTGVLPTHPTTEKGAVSVVMNFADLWVDELWHLGDYKVQSVSGSVIWLIPTVPNPSIRQQCVMVREIKNLRR